jgi:6-pyruvoyltetrahydropterin/6-carboxytetrahydropterin synthase
MKVTAERYCDFSAGHRVHGHESKCSNIHGHNYRVTFVCEADTLDSVGRVIDFGVIKSILCQWTEDHWDHRFLLWSEDDSPVASALLDPVFVYKEGQSPIPIRLVDDFGVVIVPFNPTAENMAEYLSKLGNELLRSRGIRLSAVRVEETRKCSATYTSCVDEVA